MRHNLYERQLKQEARAAKLKQDMHGEGIFLFENNTSGDLYLPKATINGKKIVGHKKQFQGDSYFMKMVRTGELRLIKTILPIGESKEMNKQEEKLLLEQPDQITEDGKIEQVVVKKPLKLNEKVTEVKSNKSKQLINEDPMAGIEIMV